MGALFQNKDYNKPLRAFILECSIREEEAASEVIKSLLRLAKPTTKTLDNKSTSLSFKNKIDLLYDIDDLNKQEYTNLVKFMELRNQFIHNPDCSSFVDLCKQSPDLAKFLETNFKNEISEQEKSYLESFKELFNRTMGKLLMLALEYNKGFTKEMHRYIDATTLGHFDDIFKSAFELWKEHREKNSIPGHPILRAFNYEKTLLDFKSSLDIAIIGEKIKVIDKIANSEVTEKDVFQRRADLLADYKKEKEQLKDKKRS